jgi:hypothetical protein
MIDSLTYKPLTDSAFPWAAELDYFKKTPVTGFKPGLNVLFGGNGSGKSTVLQLLATALAAAQGGTSVVTSSWMHDLFGFGGSELKLPCELIHDGQPVMFFDARAKEGLIAGAFDDDFFSLGVANTMAKGSTGQLGLQRLDRLLRVLVDSDRGSRRLELIEALLRASRPEGPKTLIFDEPESGFSLPWQAGLWHNVVNYPGMNAGASRFPAGA